MVFVMNDTGIGRNSTGYVNGSIDEVAIYNTTLSITDVEKLYKAGLTQRANATVTLYSRSATNFNTSVPGLQAQFGFNGGLTEALGNFTTVNNGTTINESTGVIGQGADFNSDTNTFLRTTAPVVTNPLTQTWSLAWWVTREDANNGIQVGQFDDSSLTPLWEFRLSTAPALVHTLRFDNGTTLSWSDPVESQLGFATITKTGSTIKLYYNGKLINTYTTYPTSGTLTQDWFAMGGRVRNTPVEFNSMFNGSLDQVRVYNKALTDAEVYDLYVNGNSVVQWNGGADSWTKGELCKDLIPCRSNVSASIQQFKLVYNTNTTEVSPYVLNYTVSPGTPIGIDNVFPQWKDNKTNLTGASIIGDSVYFNITFFDEDSLGGQYIFSWYNTTTWVNDSPVSWTNNTEVEVIKTVPALTGDINWTWYFNDSAGHNNQTDIFHVMLEEIPVVVITFPTNTTYTSLENYVTVNLTFSAMGDSAWCVFNSQSSTTTPISTPTNGEYNITTEWYEGSNDVQCYANNTAGAEGQSDLIYFTVDLPPQVSILQPSTTDENLVFNVSISATDTQGVDTIYYSIDNRPNVTYTDVTVDHAPAGQHIIYAWANDTFGTWSMASFNFNTSDHVGNVTSPQDCPQFYVVNGFYDNGTIKCTPQLAGTADVLFFHDEASDITNYESLYPYPANNVNVDVDTVTITSGDGKTWMGSYITNTSYPGISTIPAGIWEAELYSNVSITAGETILIMDVFRRLTNGTEILIFTVNSSDINDLTSTSQTIDYTLLTNYNLNTTDRIGVNISAQTTSGAPITVDFNYENQEASHIHTTLVTSHITPSTTTSSTTTLCPEDIFGYYNPNLPSIKLTGCNKWKSI